MLPHKIATMSDERYMLPHIIATSDERTHRLQETMVRESYVLGTNEYPFPSLMWGEVIFQRLRSFTHRLQET